MSDTNGTYNGEIKTGETITTQTGTIVWRDGYTNVTTFTVTTEPGYELVDLSGANVTEDDFQLTGDNMYTFSFTDKGVESVEYSIDGSDWTAIDVNEGVKFTTNANLLDDYTITFRVQVADGVELVLDSSGGNTVTRAEDGYYTFAFTRTAHQGYLDSNIPNVTFDLTTTDK